MNTRPLINLGIHELEEQFAGKKSDEKFLNSLLNELQHRKTKRALALRSQAVDALKATSIKPQQEIPTNTSATGNSNRQPVDFTQIHTPIPTPGMPRPASVVTKQALPRAEMGLMRLAEPERVMLTWMALEVLSPQSFLRPEDLVGGEYNRIARF